MVGPSPCQDQIRQGAGTLVSTEEFDAVAQLGVVHLAERLATKVVRSCGRGEQLVFGIAFLEFLDFRCGNVGCFGAEAVVEANDDAIVVGGVSRSSLWLTSISRLVSGPPTEYCR